MEHAEMERLTADLTSKSGKIRLLFDRGAECADIARFLDIRYQHAYNVLKNSGRLKRDVPAAADDPAGESPAGVFQVKVGLEGNITLPADYLEEHGLGEGDTLICRRERDGIMIMSRSAAMDALRDIARRRMPDEAALLEALFGDEKPPSKPSPKG